jgi:dTDP-4-amino-4,6-dideoxy-D-glucose acyltransferase
MGFGSSLKIRGAHMDVSKYYSYDELKALGFQRVGDDVQISRKCSLYEIRGCIGSFVRIDDFSMLTGHIEIGNYVHVSASCYLGGKNSRLILQNFCGVSQKVSIFTSCDDFRGEYLGNPMVPREYTRVRTGDVVLGRGCLIGAHSVVLPGVNVGEGASIGALCVISQSIEPGEIIVSPCVKNIKMGVRDLALMRKSMNSLEQRTGRGASA